MSYTIDMLTPDEAGNRTVNYRFDSNQAWYVTDMVNNSFNRIFGKYWQRRIPVLVRHFLRFHGIDLRLNSLAIRDGTPKSIREEVIG